MSDDRAVVPFELHAHTTRSDGVLTPAALVEHALARGVKVLAVTDHDTVRGISEARERGRELGIEVIAGIELTCENGGGAGAGDAIDILGYFIDPASRELAAALGRLRARRVARVDAILARLRAEGVTVFDRPAVLRREASQFGHPHLARAIVAAGHAASVDEANRKWLAPGRPAHEPRAALAAADAIAAVRAAGGVAVLAHPGRYRAEPRLERLIEAGLGGIEVYHPTHAPEQVARFEAVARSLGLVATGGADFHGDPARRPDLGGQPMPERVLKDLERAAGR